MSAAAPAAVSDSEVTAPYCPTCDAVFEDTEDAYTQILPCGHSVCYGCAFAISNFEWPACLVCKGDISEGFKPNTALLQYAVFLHGAAGVDDVVAAATADKSLPGTYSAAGIASSGIPGECTPSSDSAVASGGGSSASLSAEGDSKDIELELRLLQHKCTVSAADALNNYKAVEDARARLIARKDASISALQADVDALKAAIDAHAAKLITAAEKELKTRLKALDEQLNALMVSASQLSCAASMCGRVLHQHTAVAAHDVRDSAAKAYTLARPFKGPCASTLLEIVTGLQRFAPTLVSFARTRSDVNLDASTASGEGLSKYRVLDDNTFVMRVKDDHSMPIASVTADDIIVTIAQKSTGQPLAAQVAVRPTAEGEFRVSYRLSAGVGWITVRASVAGCSGVAGSPWHVSQLAGSCYGRGNHVRTITLENTQFYAVAVSANEQWLAVTTQHSLEYGIYVYDLIDGSLAHRIPSLRVPNSGQAAVTYRLCFTPAGHILAPESCGNVVRELTVSGTELRRFPVSSPHAVCCNDMYIVIGSHTDRDAMINVFEFDSGTFLYTLPATADPANPILLCGSLKFVPGTYTVMIGEFYHPRFTELSIPDKRIGRRYEVTAATAPHAHSSNDMDVDVCLGGRILATHKPHGIGGEVLVFPDPALGTCKRWNVDSGGAGAHLNRPCGLCIAGEHVYVLDGNWHRVLVFV